jgi:hypothetical protein
MGQILTKYNQGALGWAEIADAQFDPQNSFACGSDFMQPDGSDALYATNQVGTGTSTFTLNNAHGGTLTFATAATSTANDQAIIASPGDFVELRADRRVYFEARVFGDALNLSTANFCIGLTAATPATTVFSTASILAPANSVLIGRDQGTDSLTGAAAAGRNLQLSHRGASGSMVESLLRLPVVLSTTAWCRLGMYIQGHTIQCFCDGKKIGGEIRMEDTNAAMGFYAVAQTTNTTGRGLTIDYFQVIATR